MYCRAARRHTVLLLAVSVRGGSLLALGGGKGRGRFMGQAREAVEMAILPGRKRRTFCFLRLQLSHALAVRCLFSGSTLGRVMVGRGEGVMIVRPLVLKLPQCVMSRK